MYVLTTGVLFGMRSFAPMLGFALGAWTNSLYVDLTGNFAVFFPSVQNENTPFGEGQGCNLGSRTSRSRNVRNAFGKFLSLLGLEEILKGLCLGAWDKNKTDVNEEEGEDCVLSPTALSQSLFCLYTSLPRMSPVSYTHLTLPTKRIV